MMPPTTADPSLDTETPPPPSDDDGDDDADVLLVCDFEEQTFCGMTQLTQEELAGRHHHWLIGSGDTPTANTGPRGGSDGQFYSHCLTSPAFFPSLPHTPPLPSHSDARTACHARCLLLFSGSQYYAYMESSDRAGFSRAVLTFNLTAAAAVDAGDCVCVTLKYHMYGAGVGSLAVFAVLPSGSASRQWSRSGGL